MMKWNYTKLILFVAICCVTILGFSKVTHAESNITVLKNAPYLNSPNALDSNNNTTITWWLYDSIYVDSSMDLRYEIAIANNAKFVNAKSYFTDTDSFSKSRSEFGSNGKRFYVRVRGVLHKAEDGTVVSTSPWSETKEWTVLKINKTNFPGMYKVLKNGSEYNFTTGIKKLTYDKDKDGWLDSEEIRNITMISTAYTYKKGKLVKKAADISSFKGVEYFSHLLSIDIARFSGKKVDLSKNQKVAFVTITGISSKQITVNAPSAKNISLQSSTKGKISKIDVSACKNVVNLLAYGNKGTKTLKLPKNKKKLKVLSISEYKFKTLDLNSYTNLQQVYCYETSVKNIKVNKCKQLRYIYFFYCRDIKKLDLKSNKKLRGADFYGTPGLTKKTVKKSKSGKYTWNKGKWWYRTKAYKKDMKNLYK